MFGNTGFGGGFGTPQQQPTGFGSTFGQSSAAPFGQTSTGLFGASQPAFGQPRPAFGQPAFGASSAAFGTSTFGQPAAGASLFGQQQQQQRPAFGAVSSTPAFGASPSPFGATSTFGTPASSAGGLLGTSMPAFGSAFGAQSASAFGAASGSPVGASPFGGGGFGIGAVATQGSKAVPYQKTQQQQDGAGGQSGGPVSFISISAMPQYQGKSFEELRWEDYQQGVKGNTAAPGTPGFGATGTTATGFGFGQPQQQSAFGSPSASPTAFGAAPAGGGLFGTTPTATPAFGQTQGSLFGAASTPAFGFGASSAAPMFGGTPAPAFGAAGSSPFGTSQPSAFATSAPAFGAPSTGGMFGTTPAAPFGATSSPFGASSAGGFFGASSSPAFGASPTPAFGAQPQQQPSPFGASAPSFSFASSPAFGASAFGSSSAGFGGASTFGVGGAFGAKPAFGATPQSSPGMFGMPGTPQPSLFGQPQAPQQQQQPPPPPPAGPSLSVSPYGRLPEVPKVGGLDTLPVGPSPADAARKMRPFSSLAISPRIRAYQAPARSAVSTLNSALASSPATGTPSSRNVTSASPAPSSADAAKATPSVSNLFTPRPSFTRKFVITEPPPTVQARTPAPGPAARQPHDHNGVDGEDHLERPAQSSEPSSTPAPQVRQAASIHELVPKLQRADYRMRPSASRLSELAKVDANNLSRVSEFTIERLNKGEICWLVPVDVRGLNLDELVDIGDATIGVYHNSSAAEKPPQGVGLNTDARITLRGVYPTDKASGARLTGADDIAQFKRKLQRANAKQHARFVSYDGNTGTWSFEVEHFSRYGLIDDDEDDEVHAAGEDDSASSDDSIALGLIPPSGVTAFDSTPQLDGRRGGGTRVPGV